MQLRLNKIAQSKGLPLLIAVAVGAFIGFGAWGEGRLPFLAAVLPFAIGISGSRARAFLMGLAYVLATERAGPAFMAAWFDGSFITASLLWLGSGVIGGLAWSLAWTSSNVPWRKAAASVLAWAVTLLPPVAVVVMGHPIVAWGNIMPGTGWIGVLASVAVPAIFMWTYSRSPWPLHKMTLLFIPVAGAVAGAGVYAYYPIESRFVGEIAAVSTNWGAAQDDWEILQRIERIGRTNERFAKETDVHVLIYPEAAIQRYDPALYLVLKMEIIDAAARAGQTIVLGADLPTRSGNLESAAIAFYPNGTTATAIARQTVPIALWKPWQASGSFLTNWTANNLLTLSDGVRARVIFCYEEYIPFLSLINEAKDAHNIVVVMANTWASKDQLGATIQARHSEGIAKLFGKHLLRAENRPKKEH
ncbi:nitrilase-related carbon-nitrogen hydrolase [Polaromonas aquatica]|uniref:Nitrilase-related carbon-nitrogen hydrolase n=2 Tax=Polaromonas aquatica TaxID=332657 RepID=A0ABW1TVB9_9BURK